jgi:rubrerythrin
MKASAPELTSFVFDQPKPDSMHTLVCKNCRMALYMADRKLKMPTWRCPSCGAITHTK